MFLIIVYLAFGIANGLITFKYESTSCPMYTNNCKIEFNTIDKNNTLIQIPQKQSRYFKFVSFELCPANSCNQSYIEIEPIIIGIDSYKLKYDNITYEHKIIITSPNRFIDKIFQGYIIVVQLTIATIMGILLNFDTLVKIVKMPLPVIIGFTSQYLFMPLLGFCIIKLSSQPAVDALALFIYSCCPGGSASNNWSILLNGDIDLSAMLTFVSTMASFFCMPIWLYTLGSVFTSAADIQIPFSRLVINLFTTIGPCIFGLLLSKCFPKLKPMFIKIVKPLMIIILLSFLALTMFARFYVFYLINFKQWLVGPLIPWIGFLLGGLIAKLARLPHSQVITVGIETGIQNVGIAFLIVTYNFPSPQSDYAILPLISVSALTGIPLWITLLVKGLKNRFCPAKDIEKEQEMTKVSSEEQLKQQEKLLN